MLNVVHLDKILMLCCMQHCIPKLLLTKVMNDKTKVMASVGNWAH